MDITYIIIVLLTILVSMTLHEAMHGFVAYWLGDDTAKHSGRLTLNPLKHIDPFMTILLPLTLAVMHLPIFGGAKPVPFNPQNVKYGDWGVALVALAGPLTNFFIAFVCYGVLALAHIDVTSLAGTILLAGVMVNLGFFVFNMLPIPPLDGSRVLYALAPEFARRAMEAVERYGVFLVFAIVLVASPFITTIMGSIINAILRLFSDIFSMFAG